ncbi:putative sigma-54 modulation protein [Oxobacter pfennigii]|uniref:Ribosome hibernation promoting factor n=1 Tax=Oxobacter pfennigii TaxID=36849 RepID=A0A0P8YYB6_9CLOT|nr:ribosome-associated translation inhibitor RaiA [Oxobacter pfennigii]KPU44755.1 putative sigma-54 modulation protein [Oxobacter pfennigii]
MKIIVSGKNIDVTDALKDTVIKKISKLDKYFNPEVEAQATLSVQKNRHIIEVTIPFDGSILRGEEATDDMYTSIDKVLDKLEKQIAKHKTRMERKLKTSSIRLAGTETDLNDDEDSLTPVIVKTKRFAIKPMPVDEAVMQMDLLGHSFYVFLNGETEEVNVVYKRNDGKYGLIEPEF